jgi:tryptophanyl-tRNA synthetase
MLDEPAEIARKVRRAVTDTDGEMRYDPAAKPGLANLLDIFAALTRRKPVEIAGEYERYGPLKDDLAEAMSEELRPVRERYAELSRDPGEVLALLAKGADKARELAAPTLSACKEAVGLLRS